MEISDEQFRELLDRYLNGTATAAEREILDKFFESYESDSTEPAFTEVPQGLRDDMLREIHRRVGHNRVPRRRLLMLWLPIAATIALFVLAYLTIRTGDYSAPANVPQALIIQDSTGSGQRIVKVLPDGTRVHLNSKSVIRYPETFGPVREISLTGEGYFEVVSNGKPFVVRSGGVQTRVLGTSFNVRHRPESNIEITLAEGKVNVVSPHGDSLMLSPGEQAVVEDAAENEITKRHVNVMRYSSWKDNILFFEQTPFEDAVREIEEWYDVSIDIANPSLRRCLITAKYQNEPLGNVLSSMQFLLSLNIKRLDESHFLVRGNGCQ